MAKTTKPDPQFEIEFFTRRSSAHRDTRVVGLFGRLHPGRRIGRRPEDGPQARRLERTIPTAHYNLACSLALCKKRPAASSRFRKAVPRLRAVDWMLQEPRFEILKPDRNSSNCSAS